MKPYARTVAVLFAGVALVASAEERLPKGWLAALEVADVVRLDTRVARLAAPWGGPPPSLEGLIEPFLSDGLLADRPWVIALAETPTGAATPLLYAPTDDFDALCAALDADLADELGVATIAGFDVALIRVGDWARVALLDAPPPEERSNAPIATGRSEDLSIRTSQLGRARLASLLKDRRRAMLREGRNRSQAKWAWGGGVEASLGRLASAAPFFASLAEMRGVVTAALDLDEESDAFVLKAEFPLREKPPMGQPANAPALRIENPIANLRLNRSPPPELMDLLFAAMECRPGEIDAVEYAQPQWDDFAQACVLLLQECRAIDTVLTFPGEGEPVAANQAAVLDYSGGPAEFADRLNLAVARWNLLVAATEARTPLRVVMQPHPRKGGWRLTVDLFEGMKIARSSELEALFDRYYGANGQVLIDFLPVDANRWLMTMGRDFNPDAIGEQSPTEGAALATGRLRLDLWKSWSDALRQAGESGVDSASHASIDKVPQVTVSVRATDAQSGPRLILSASLPTETYRAAASHLLDN